MGVLTHQSVFLPIAIEKQLQIKNNRLEKVDGSQIENKASGLFENP